MSAAGRILLLLALLLAACGPAAPAASDPPSSAAATAPTPTASPSATTTPAPTATEPPAVTPTVESTPTVEPTSTDQPGATPEPSLTAEPAQPQLAFIDPDGFLQRAATDGTLTPIWDSAVVQASAWAPDGRRLAFVSDGALYVWDAATGAATPVLRDPPSTGAPTWSADGQQIAVATHPQPDAACSVDAPCTITLVAADGSGSRALGQGMAPHFAPAGTALLAASLDPQPPQNREADWSAPIVWPDPTSAPITLADASSAAAHSRASWSADGSLVAVGNVLLDASGALVEQLAPPDPPPAYEGTATVANGQAPDGETLALATLVVTRTDVGFLHSTTLTLYGRSAGSRTPIWQELPEPELPPGPGLGAQDRPVAVRRSPPQTGHGRYWRVSPVTWSPDGTQLAFAGCGAALADPAQQGCGLWLAAGDGARLRLVPDTGGAEGVEAAGHAPQFAPDGSTLAFVQLARGDEPGFEVWTWSSARAAPPQLVGRGMLPRWQP